MKEEKRREEKRLPRSAVGIVLATVALGGITRSQALPGCQEEKLRPLGAVSPNDTQFGEALDIDGDYLIVGAPKADRLEGSPFEIKIGVAFIYKRDVALQLGSRWDKERTLQMVSINPMPSDLFGQSVAITDPRAVVGAPADDHPGSPNIDEAGSVFLWKRSGTTWTEEQRLTAPSPAANDFFGWSVGLDDSVGRVVIGAIETDGRPGSAYVSQRSGTTWGTPVELNPTTAPSNDDNFGVSVSIDGATIVVGADKEDTASPFAANTGSAVVFLLSGSTWQEEAKLLAPSLQSAANDEFGCSVSVSGDYAAIGAPRREHGGHTDAGEVFIFVRSGTSWSYQTTLDADTNADDNDQFGASVSLDGTTLLVGTKNAESAYVFSRSGTTWTPEEPILSTTHSATAAKFGSAVALSGDLAAIGALADDTGDIGGYADSGSAYVFVPFDEGVQNYCTAKSNTVGALPLMMAVAGGYPSASSTGNFYVEGRNIVVYQTAGNSYSSTGFMHFSTGGRQSTTWHGGKLCVKSPGRYTPDQFEVYDPSYLKTSKGVLAVEFNSFIQGGDYPELMAGEKVQLQWIFHDPWDMTSCPGMVPCQDGLTDGLEFVICP